MPRRDVKPLAKALVAKFGSFAEATAAPPARLAEVEGLGEACVAELKVVQAAANRLLRGATSGAVIVVGGARLLPHRAGFRRSRAVPRPVSRQTQPAYRRRGAAGRHRYHAPVYPREVVKLVHNHPSGDPTPSHADIQMTQQIIAVASPLGISVHDHIIFARKAMRA